MKVILREEESGVTEVVGTILILAMTVVLFSVVIIWVTSIPTPVAQTRLDVAASITPVYNTGGTEVAANITLRHQGGESLPFVTTTVYVTTKTTSGACASGCTDILRNRGTIKGGADAGRSYGLIDGGDDTWNVGERWTYQNHTIRASADTVSVTVVDMFKSIVLWSQELNPPAGTRPPVFLEKWEDGIGYTGSIDPVYTGLQFWIFAKVFDPDGDLKVVYANITIAPAASQCSRWQDMQMYDDGPGGGHGDLVAGDGTYTLIRNCMNPPTTAWDGSIVLFNATDKQGHNTVSRMILDVVQNPNPSDTGNGTGSTGRPQNLRWNGRQGYNIFNATEWDRKKYTATPIRTFRGAEEVVVVVGSLDLENTFAQDQFTLWDPFSGFPTHPVVYGSNKAVTQNTKPSSMQAFSFLEFINGYYIYTYRFKLNAPTDPLIGTNFYRSPPANGYYFGRYTLDILLSSASGVRFSTSDSVNITDEDGFQRTFPQVLTYSDSGFSSPTQTFRSTDVVYIQVNMFTVDPALTNVLFGNIVISDYAGGTQVWRAPAGGTGANSPICPITGSTCTGTAITISPGTISYRFALNLSRADQDPWVDGTQNYALTVTTMRDTDETYADVSTQLVIVAPLYRLDIVIGNQDTSSNAWGTHDYSYYYENVNGFDRWRKDRVEYCGLAGTSACPSNEKTLAVTFLDFDLDGDLDIAASLFIDNSNGEVVLYRRDLDFTGNVIFTRFSMEQLSGYYCNALTAGDVTGDAAPELVCGGSNGQVWYYKNDGSWQGSSATKIVFDTTRAQSISSVVIGDFNGDKANDIAVGGASGRLTWYPNLDGHGRFANTGITDDWFATGETLPPQTIGSIASGSYLSTYVLDGSSEQVQETTVTETSRAGSTTNPTVDAAQAPWTYADWESGANALGEWHNTGGNPNGLLDLHTNFAAGTTVSGYWYQTFTVSGSVPYTATVQFDRKISQIVAGASVTVYVFVDPTAGAPVLGDAIATLGPHTATTAWLNSSTISVPAGRLPAAGTYYLKIAARTTNPGSGSGTTITQFDNIQLSWLSTGGTASELTHYWRMQTLPSRAGTTFTFNLRARHGANTEGDNFVLAYSINVAGNDPTTGTYTSFLWVNVTTDTTFSYNLPTSVAGKTVWVRVMDMDHTVGNTVLDSVFVDQMYIRATTPSGTTGANLVNPGDSTAVNAIDADDQDADGYSDLVAGTAGGKAFKYIGSSGGLQTPLGAFYTYTSAILGVKFANVSSTQTGMEIVFAYASKVRIITGYGNGPGVQIGADLTYTGSGLSVLGVGDVNGDGYDDVVVGTTGVKAGEVFLWENLNNGLNWSSPWQVDNVGGGVTSMSLGDASKSQYFGR